MGKNITFSAVSSTGKMAYNLPFKAALIIMVLQATTVVKEVVKSLFKLEKSCQLNSFNDKL